MIFGHTTAARDIHHTNCFLQIIAVGSPFGDDQLGWAAAEQLRDSPIIRTLNRVRIVTLDRPGALLVEYLRASQKVILIDAIKAGAVPGSLYTVRGDTAFIPDGSLSTHGFGLAETLTLAATLECLPESWIVIGIEPQTTQGSSDISEPVRLALPILVSAVEQEAVASCRESCGQNAQRQSGTDYIPQ